MLQGLQAILEKEVVLSTVNADDLLHNPQRVESEYQRHVATFVPMGDVTGFSARLIRRVLAAKTPKGMIVAPYGYGKTSTLAFLWHECETQKLVAVPPFYCATLLDILKATYGWMRFRLEHTQPDLISDLNEVYSKYTAATVEEMAKGYAQEHGLAPVIAVNMLNDMLEAGRLVLELTPSNLLFFLDAVSTLAGRAGFKGLVIFPDEFQQYFSKGANLRRTVQDFREFVWGLDTRSNCFGTVFSVPTYAESVIQEQGKDILARLKKDDLYYRLQDIYSVEFPAQLWGRYADTFGLRDLSQSVLDAHTLRAIGQIAEREDLGEGPRTVIDSFKRAVLHFQDHRQSYTPVDLVDDFLSSNIRFQSQFKSIVRQALDSGVVDAPDKKQAIKLLASFPRGCPVETQKDYGLHSAVVALSKQSHGELLVRLAEGDTLVGLTRNTGPVHTVDRVVTQFWQSYEEDELHLEAAVRAFANRLLPRFFQQKKGAAIVGWSDLKFEPSTKGSYVALAEGTFIPRFPRRLLGLQVGYSENQLQPPLPAADLQFDFLFGLNGHEDSGHLELSGSRVARFYLNLQRKVGATLPDDIRKLQEFVLPEFVTPLLMLSLVDYFDRWEQSEEETVPESDKVEMEHYSGRLIGHAAQLLFNQGFGQSTTPPLRRVSGQMMEELFNRLCETLYPDYRTFYVHTQHEAVLNDYTNALRSMTLKERRGHVLLTGTKEALARRFGIGSVATFENRIQNEYANLMKRGEWRGRGDQGVGEIALQLHPLEEAILTQLRNSTESRLLDGCRVPVLSGSQVASLARSLGYRDEETLLALQLLAARGYVRVDKETKVVYLSQLGPDASLLRERMERLTTDLSLVPPGLVPAKQLEPLQSSLSATRASLEKALQDEEELDEIQTRLTDLGQQFSGVLSERRGELRGQINALVLEIDRILIQLQQADVLDREIQGQVAFVMHLNELRQRLSSNRRQLVTEYGTLKQELVGTAELATDGPITEALALYGTLEKGQKRLEALGSQLATLRNQTGQLERWIKLLKDTDQLFNAVAHLSDLREQLIHQVVPEIQAHLTKRRLEGLADWEPFSEKVRAIETELEAKRRYGNEAFGQAKANYEDFLRGIEVADYRPRTRYTYGEDEASYRDLYEEVRTKIEGRLGEVATDLKREQTDLLKVKYIQIVTEEGQKLIQEIERQLSVADSELTQLRRALTVGLVKKAGDELNAYGKRIRDASLVTASAHKQLGPLLHSDHELTPQETKVLGAMDTKSDLDLTDLFVQMRSTDPQTSLSDLVSILEKLFRKNRIMVRLRTRG